MKKWEPQQQIYVTVNDLCDLSHSHSEYLRVHVECRFG